MKICFVASIKGKESHENDYRKIVGFLKTTGDTIMSDHVMEFTQSKLDSLTEKEKIVFNKSVFNLIKKSDIVVAEISYPSMSVGYLISLSLNLSKPTIVLYSGNDNGSNLLSTIEETDKLFIGKYSSEGKNLEDTLFSLLTRAKGSSDVRFNFFVAPKHLAYLDWVAKTKKLPRAVFLRDLIEKEMKKDKAFRE